MEVTKKLAFFSAGMAFTDIPKPIIQEAKNCFLDWLGVSLAAAHDPEVESLVGLVDYVGGNKQASIIGRDLKTSVLNAALLNGMISHVLDFDDTSLVFIGHPSVTIFPGLLAAGECWEKSGEDFLCSYVIGYEVGCRVALGATIKHYEAGWHGTSTIGHFAAAASAARLMGLNAEQISRAFGIAATQAAGLKVVFGTACKSFHAGKAALDGLMAALLAKRGFTSIDNILEIPQGFWELFSPCPDPESALKGLGENWHLSSNQYKFHASCHFTHSPIEAAKALKQSMRIDAADIKLIEIKVSPQALQAAGKSSPQTPLEAKFSISYCVANALLRADTGMAAFTDARVRDPEVTRLCEKIYVNSSDQMAFFEAEISCETKHGRLTHKNNMMTTQMDQDEKKEKLRNKFRDLGSGLLKREQIEQLISRVDKLEQEKSMADFIKLLKYE